jgi:hypothetical protein
MRVLETKLAGKHPDPIKCEDRLVLTGGLVAVVDGATDKSGITIDSPYGPISTGRFAADVVAGVLERSTPGVSPAAMVAEITATLDAAIERTIGNVRPHDRPAASVVVFDPTARLVWRVGDCALRIDDTVFAPHKRIDQVTSDFRSAMLAATPPTGDHDHGREAVLPLLRMQGVFANTIGEFGYGVLNGTSVPSEYLEVFSLAVDATEIVLASDGYPELSANLGVAEARLAALLEIDPWCVGPLRSTKGLQPGLQSFDDRAWVRIEL